MKMTLKIHGLWFSIIVLLYCSNIIEWRVKGCKKAHLFALWNIVGCKESAWILLLLHLFPTLCAFWFLEITVLRKSVSVTELLTKLRQIFPFNTKSEVKLKNKKIEIKRWIVSFLHWQYLQHNTIGGAIVSRDWLPKLG